MALIAGLTVALAVAILGTFVCLLVREDSPAVCLWGRKCRRKAGDRLQDGGDVFVGEASEGNEWVEVVLGWGVSRGVGIGVAVLVLRVSIRRHHKLESRAIPAVMAWGGRR